VLGRLSALTAVVVETYNPIFTADIAFPCSECAERALTAQ